LLGYDGSSGEAIDRGLLVEKDQGGEVGHNVCKSKKPDRAGSFALADPGYFFQRSHFSLEGTK